MIATSVTPTNPGPPPQSVESYIGDMLAELAVLAERRGDLGLAEKIRIACEAAQARQIDGERRA